MQSTNSKKIFILALLIFFPSEVFAYSGKLTGQDIKEILTGASIHLDTPFGTTIPISLGSDGIITGQAGRLATYLGSAEDRGRWWISNNKLCFKWFKWLHGEPQCLSLKLNDHQILWVLDDGMEGTATLSEKPLEEKKYILTTPPQLALRPLAAPKKLFASSDVSKNKDIFSLGVHLSRALRSEKKYKRVELSAMQATSEKKSNTSVRIVSQAATPDTTEIQDLRMIKKIRETAPPLNGEFATASAQSQISTVKYFAVSGLENGDTLNIRSGPSLDQAIVGEIPQNSINIKFIGPCMNFWCRIQYKNVFGWVNRYYLADTMTASKQNYN